MAASPFQPLVDVTVKAFAEMLSVPLFSFLWSWVKRIIPLFVVLLLLLSIALSAYTFFRQQRDRQLKFYVSAGSSSGADQADLIQKKIRDRWSFWGPNYLVTEFPTGGSLDNLRNVKRGQEGNTIGLAIEGIQVDKNDTHDLNTLVPLQWCYLHFIFRTEVLKRLEITFPAAHDGSAITPISLHDWAKKVDTAIGKYQKLPESQQPDWWPIRLYLGQPNSGTRQLAEMVLIDAGIHPKLLEPNKYISDVEEVPEQLLRENIDGAFILEPPGSSLVTRLAADKDIDCTLISIKGVDDLLQNNRFLVPSKIRPYTYPFSFRQHDSSAPNVKDRGDTHLAGVETIATRRILVASSKMNNEDAYYLANFVREALPSGDIAYRANDESWPGPDGKDSQALNYDLHPGVVWNVRSEPGINWFGRNATWLAPLLLAMAISLVTEVKNRLPGWLAQQPPPTSQTESKQPKSPGPGGISARATLDAQIDKLFQEIHDAREVEIDTGHSTSADVMEGWRKRTGELYRQVHEVHRSGNLTAADKLELNARLLQLRHEQELLKNPPWRTAATRGSRHAKKTQEPPNEKPPESPAV